MIEVYVNTYGSIEIDVRDREGNLIDPEGDVSVEVFDYGLLDEETGDLGVVIDEGLAVQRFYGSSPATGRYYYQIGPEITDNPKTLKVTWSYSLAEGEQGEQRVFSDNVFVSVPYVSIQRLRELKELNDYSDQEIMAMERLVARVIDSFCGQSFGYEKNKTKTTVGADSDYLLLPGRIWTLDNVSILDDFIRVIKDSEGNVVDIDRSGRSIIEYVMMDVDNPWRLRNRRSEDYIAMTEVRRKNFFKNGTVYAITGDWGYQYVPSKISEAATILVKTYFYDDSTYRDRYISEIQAGTWRMKFRSTGDETTGSANVDMILSDYRNINAAVL